MLGDARHGLGVHELVNSLTVCEALGLSRLIVTLREPTLLGLRGDRGGETESSDMVSLARSPGSLRLLRGGACWGRAQPRSSGRLGAGAFVEPLAAVRI